MTKYKSLYEPSGWGYMPSDVKNKWEYWHGNVPYTLTCCLRSIQEQRNFENATRVQLQRMQWDFERTMAMLNDLSQTRFTLEKPEPKSVITKIKEFFTS